MKTKIEKKISTNMNSKHTNTHTHICLLGKMRMASNRRLHTLLLFIPLPNCIWRQYCYTQHPGIYWSHTHTHTHTKHVLVCLHTAYTSMLFFVVLFSKSHSHSITKIKNNERPMGLRWNCVFELKIFSHNQKFRRPYAFENTNQSLSVNHSSFPLF